MAAKKKRTKLPKILKKAAEHIKSGSGYDKSSAFAAATASLQKAGVLKKGKNSLTKKGKKRSKMTSKARASSRKKK